MEGPLVAPPEENAISTPTSTPIFDPKVLVDHLSSLLIVTLGATKSELEAYPSLLSQSELSETLQRCSRFTSDSQAALYVRKDVEADAHHTNGTNGSACKYTRYRTMRNKILTVLL
jgi:dynein heavy chain 1, cytosolic